MNKLFKFIIASEQKQSEIEEMYQKLSLDDCEDSSTKASSNKPNKGEPKIIYTEELNEVKKNHLNTVKISSSPEIKLSNKEVRLLPAWIKDCEFLRPVSNQKLDSNITLAEPKGIFRFLQDSNDGKIKLNIKNEAWSEAKGQTILSFLSSTAASKPKITHG